LKYQQFRGKKSPLAGVAAFAQSVICAAADSRRVVRALPAERPAEAGSMRLELFNYSPFGPILDAPD